MGDDMDPREIDVQFFSLISMLASACWQQLGKTPSQPGDAVERDLAGAKSTIEMLLMLRDKMWGNLTGTEEKLLDDTISKRQESYAEEAAEAEG